QRRRRSACRSHRAQKSADRWIDPSWSWFYRRRHERASDRLRFFSCPDRRRLRLHTAVLIPDHVRIATAETRPGRESDLRRLWHWRSDWRASVEPSSGSFRLALCLFGGRDYRGYRYARTARLHPRAPQATWCQTIGFVQGCPLCFAFAPRRGRVHRRLGLLELRRMDADSNALGEITHHPTNRLDHERSEHRQYGRII